MLAGERSGVGKSTIAVGLLLALENKGKHPQPFKAGPDFLDPMQHSIMLGRPSRNLDTWMLGDRNLDLFLRSSSPSGISVIEGVMGLYDGVNGISEEGSSAHLSKILRTPVIIVLDASGSARSVGAVALGFKEYDPQVNVAGVIFNHIGGERHLKMLRDSLRGMECLGGIPNDANIELKSRHLGLVPATEAPDSSKYERIRAIIEQNCDIDRIISIADSAPDIGPEVYKPLPQEPKRARIGIARDAAFNFYYEDSLDVLRCQGAELIPFSPLNDDLPDVDALYFGGGYPEIFAKDLAANVSIRQNIKKAASDGMPLYAECGGMMYTCRSIKDMNGMCYDMVGLFDAEVEMTPRLQAIGYVEASVVKDCVLAPPGASTRGHEFHFSRVISNGERDYAYQMKRGRGICDGKDGMVNGKTLASYTHLHFAACPEFARNFVDKAERYSQR